ncbi:uncharacterized protein LOC127832524 [Dreissena polymorpha]|uniref:Myb/SANT-like DNA-binding domain-containing protein n=1 Tax=Dreissena polymorpha TaxID=45954 RepID=A0A9D4H6M9_DREPO|nr:uncharacterized protein LOC127832524 [Dreissena polymorpha]KAH3828403.1 hypothetical protein DPMN_130362 [Dreissena polymorpha]
MAKQRAPNFTLQENILLAHLMGEDYSNFGMSRHKLDRHRFTSQISSSVKKEMWGNVETAFNSNSTGTQRKGSDLEKKWENLTSTQRGIYQDHQRMLTLTGRPPFNSKCTILTEAVMNVIGKEGVDVMGIGPRSLDTSMLQLTHMRDDDQQDTENNMTTCTSSGAMSTPVSVNQKRRYTPSVSENGSSSSAISPRDEPSHSCCSHCSLHEIKRLKKRKLELQIRFYEAQLARLGEE